MEIFETYKELLNLCFDKPPSDVPDVWMKLIEKYPVDIVTIKKDGKIIGCVTVVKLSNAIFSIEWTVIHPDFKNKGYGKKLMEKVHKKYKGLFIVKTNNASTFYKKLGYKEIYNENTKTVLAYMNDMENVF
jgi:N-acetylglutamate synthase-like GNAT family acetyltransferase